MVTAIQHPKHTPPGRQAPPRFKSALPLSMASKMFLHFETKYEPGFILVSKVLGNAMPRIAITRTKDEFLEVLFNEGTQTAGFFGMLPVASWLLNPIQAKMAGLPTQLIKQRNEEVFAKLSGRALNNIKVAKLGKSLAVLSFIFYLKIAMPYIRNWFTIKRTGFSDYKDVVALGGKRLPNEEDKRKAKAAIRKNLLKTNLLLAAGAINALAVMGYAAKVIKGGGLEFAKKGLLNPKRLEWLVHNFALVGKNSNQVMSLTKSYMPTFWFWGVPSYLGWFTGCRDKYEVVEQMSKFGTFLAGYMGVTPAMAAIMKRVDGPLLKKVAQVTGKAKPPGYKEVIIDNALKTPELSKQFLRHLNNKNGWALMANLFIVGALPLVFNIYFSNWRYQREQAEKLKQQQQAQPPAPATNPEIAPVAPKPVKPAAPLPPARTQPLPVKILPPYGGAYLQPWPSYQPYYGYAYGVMPITHPYGAPWATPYPSM